MTQQRSQSEPVHPNHYELKHQHTIITYDTTALDGQPHLSYHVPASPLRTFRGEEIRLQESEIGTLVTVTLETVPDDKTTVLTLLIPAINLIGTTEQGFETIGITTVERTSIGGPSLVSGAIQSYHTMRFEGKAQFVVS